MSYHDRLDAIERELGVAIEVSDESGTTFVYAYTEDGQRLCVELRSMSPARLAIGSYDPHIRDDRDHYIGNRPLPPALATGWPQPSATVMNRLQPPVLSDR